MNKIAVALLAIIAVASVASAYAYTNYFAIDNSQVDVKNSNVTISDSTVTYGENVTITNPPTPAPNPEMESEATQSEAMPTPSPEPELAYDYVIYEWHLKADYLNNATWMEGYYDYLASMKYNPMPSIWVVVVTLEDVFVNAEFNAETGWTRATYEYREAQTFREYKCYGIETVLPNIADSRGWTKSFV